MIMKLQSFGLICALALGIVTPLQAQTFCNAAPILVPGTGTSGVASPYPSTVTVSGVPNPTALTLTIKGLSHAFPDDIDMLLVGPFGQKMIVQSDAGGNADAVNVTYTLSDAGETALPDSIVLLPGTYRPASYDSAGGDAFAAPAPAGPYNEPFGAGTSTLRSSFSGINANGVWSLYVVDDSSGDSGSIAQGWCLNFAGASAVSPLRISEFRVRGPGGATDEFVELMNISNSPITVASFDGSSGYSVAASDGTTRCFVFNGTSIPAYGHFLCANSAGYSLAAYPSGDGTTATADSTFALDIPDNAGIALFAVSNVANFNAVNRLDAVGSTSEANTLYKEGAGYPALTPSTPSSINHAWVRDDCGKGGAINSLNPCPFHGIAGDSNNNAADFVFVDTNGTSVGGGQRLGAPGPQNLIGPTGGRAGIESVPLDTCKYRNLSPNIVRDFTSNPGNVSTDGTLDIRRTYTNNTGAPLTRLRFRIVDLNTFPAILGTADLRPIASSNIVVSVDRPPCGSGTSNITVLGTTLEQPPNQPNGGGFNTSYGVPAVTAATPLADLATIDLRFVSGIQQTGMYRLDIVPEALPFGGGHDPNLIGCTDGVTCGEFIFRDDFEF
jgi:subtilisin-like proprotein convertase family protein